MAMFQSLITAGLVVVFSSEMNSWYKILSAGITLILVYLFGWVDEKIKLLEREQQEYTERNPTLKKMAKDIERIKNELELQNLNKNKL
ncbi:MAG: hypothetical protein GYA51_11445 [Candidatus Methanofastidiosa archaeon]|nr:hypothetical protein [Candidatus Methanofastidiosa archaeon]